MSSIICPIAGRDADLQAALKSAGLPIDDLNEPGRRFFRIERAGLCLGYGGVEIYGEDALLRSVVVPEAQRPRGGRELGAL